MPLPLWQLTVGNAPQGADDIHIMLAGAINVANPMPRGTLPVFHPVTWNAGNPNELNGAWQPPTKQGDRWQGELRLPVAPVVRRAWWTKGGERIGEIPGSDFVITRLEGKGVPLTNPRLWRAIGVTALGLATIAFAMALSFKEADESE